MNDHLRRIGLIIAVFGLLSWPFGGSAAGQHPQVEQMTNIFAPAPRPLRQQLSRARKALAERQYNEAVDRLGQLLATPEQQSGLGQFVEQDYFLAGTKDADTQVSLKSEARRLLGAMPSEGRDLYELKFGTDARQMLESGMETRDIQKLVEVTRRYFHTRAGYESTMLIGRYHLDQGRPFAAALRFQLLASSSAATAIYDPELSVLLATCWLLADMPDRARETLVGLKNRSPRAAIRVGDRSVAIFDNENKALAWLTKLIGAGFAAGPVEATEWVMFRGGVARNAESSGGFPLLTPRWLVRAANHPTDEELIRQQQQTFTSLGSAAIPSLHPLAVSDTILMRTPRQLVAVDFEAGKRIWVFPWFEPPSDEELYNDRVRPVRHNQDPRAMKLRQRVWDDAPYGQMSCDGNQIFVLWGLTSNMTQRSVNVWAGGRIGPNVYNTSRINKLVALDLKSEGKLRWIVGDEDGTDEPKLAGAFFLGAPLPLMGQLYALVELNGEIRLVVLDAQTGQLDWSQQLAHVEMRDISVDPGRRSAGASPSFSDGVLVCPTSAGAVVAVDISTRSLLWGYQYPQAHGAGPFQMHAYRYQPKQIGQRWADASVTIADGRVMVTPVESSQLICLDLLTGQLAWKPKPRNGLLYVGCVAEGKAIMIGAREVQAISLSDGTVAWTRALPTGVPSGRGFLTGKEYYLPTTAKHLLKIDVTSGEIVRDMETDRVLGNLIAYKDQIISQNVDWLSAFYQTEPLRLAVDERLKERPDDTWALTRHAELLLSDGKHSEAVTAFQHAYRLNPQDDEIRGSLVSSLLSALRKDFQRNSNFAVELESLVDQPAQRAEFYRLMAVGLQTQGDSDKALEFFVKLAAMDPSPTFGSETLRGELIQIDDRLKVRRDRWIRVHFGQLLTTAKGESREHIDQLIGSHFGEVLQTKSIRRLSRFIDHFGAHPLGRRAQLELARLLIDRERLLDAEQQLVSLQESGDPEFAAQATAILARLFQTSDKLPEAVICYRRLTEQFGDVIAGDAQTGRQVVVAARADESLRRALDEPASWPQGKCVVETESKGMMPSSQRISPVHLTDVTGPFPENYSIDFDQQQFTILLRDGFGEMQQRVMLGDRNRFHTLNMPAGRASARGHLLVVSVGFEVLAIDALRDATGRGDVVLWRHDLSSSMIGAPSGIRRLTAQMIQRPWGPTRYVPTESQRGPIGQVGPITQHGVVYQKMKELTCVDPLTGAPVWSRTGILDGCDIFGDDEYLFVVPPEANEALVLRTADGTELGRRIVAPRKERWVNDGRHVLVCHTEGDKLRLRWFDAWQQKDIWVRTVDARAQCWLPGRDELAVIEPSGKFVVLRLADGHARVETQMEPEPKLARLYVFRSRDQYTVVASARLSASSTSSSGFRTFGILGANQCPQIDARIYAINRQDGKLQWPSPAVVHRFTLPLDQPTETPVLMFLQNDPPRARVNSSAAKATLLCLDKRNGRSLLLDKELATIRNYQMVGRPATQSVEIKTNSKNFLLTFTGEEVPDEPPLRMEHPPTAGKNTIEQAGKIAGAILDVIAASKEKAKPQAKKKNEKPNKTEKKE